jgi:hypothetical protein
VSDAVLLFVRGVMLLLGVGVDSWCRWVKFEG